MDARASEGAWAAPALDSCSGRARSCGLLGWRRPRTPFPP